MRLPAPFLRKLVLRGVAIWLFARVAAFLVSEFARSMAGDAGLPLEIATSPAAVVVVAAALVLADLHRRREVTLLNNLGSATGQAVLIGCIPAFVLEGARAVLVA